MLNFVQEALRDVTSYCVSSMGSFCSNCFGHNILSPFPWVHLRVTEFIDEVNDLCLDCLDDPFDKVYLKHPLLLVELFEVQDLKA